MKETRHVVLLAITAVILPCTAQAQSGQSPSSISGSGQANHIAVWKNGTTLTSSGIFSLRGDIGIGTTTPTAKLEVNGDALFDGNLNFTGVILSNGVQTLWAPIGASGNFSAGLNALQPTATGYYNTAVGTVAMAANVNGSDNTAVGTFSMNYNTGSENTSVGFETLTHATGNNNIALGCQAGYQIQSTSNNIEIGNQGSAADSGAIRIGTSFSSGCTTCQTSTYIAGIYGAMTGLAGVSVVVDANGQLGTMSSSRRYKEDIQDMGDTSSSLMQLRPVTFRYKKAYDDGSRPVQYGLIAEEVANVYPDLVTKSADGQVEAVKYQLLDPMLLNELQKQHVTIAAQKEQIQSQADHIRSLEDRLARVEAMFVGGDSRRAGQ
jgi:hypothetical protein